jgi:hypothetical protein
MKRTRHSLLKGIDAPRFLRAAAKEMDALGKMNARMVAVDGGAHVYSPGIVDLFYLDCQRSDGSWEARTLCDVGGQGALSVHRVIRENLLPAMTMQAIEYLVRGGRFNEFEPAKRFVLDECRFRHAGSVSRFDAEASHA